MMMFMSPLILLTLFFGGESSLSGYINPEQYWQSRGVEYRVADLAAFLQSPVPVDPSEIEKSIKGLGAETFADREAASSRLAEIGMPALPALQVASKNPDPEVSKRAKIILQTITAEKEEDAVDPGMVLMSLSCMKDPQAGKILQEIANGPAGELQRQAASFLSQPQREVPPLSQDIFAGFPEDTCMLLQLQPHKYQSAVLNTVHHSAALQKMLISGFEMFGDIKVQRVSMGMNEGVFLGKDPRIILRVEMAYDPRRLALALEKIRYQQISTEPMRILRHKELSIFMPDDRNLIVFLDYQNRPVAELADAQALLKSPENVKVSADLLHSLKELPETFPLRGVLQVSAEAMKKWEDFSSLRQAAFSIDPVGDRLKIYLKMQLEDAVTAKKFSAYAESQLTQIKELFAQENGQWIEPMRHAVNALKLSASEKNFEIGGILSEAVILGTVEMMEMQLKQMQDFRQQRNQRFQRQDLEVVF
jgi:hypothetical protein